MVNLKIIIPIIIIVIIASAIAFSLEQETIEEEVIVQQWIKSGPFSIEKSEYNLGEKIFLTVSAIPKSESGEVMFFRPSDKPVPQKFENIEGVPKDMIKSKIKYLGIEFDGSSKENFNRYFEPKMNVFKNICSKNDLIGEWVIIFHGTDYNPIYFEIINQTSSWENRTFEPVC